MVQGYTITAKAKKMNASKKEDRFSIRTVSKKEALKEAHKHFRSGGWSKSDYTIADIQVSA